MGATITWFDKQCTLNQVPSGTIQYSWASQDDKQCHPWVFCKDYLQDAVHATINGDKGVVYGFSFTPKDNPPVALKNTRLLLSNMSDKNFGEKQENMLEFINICGELLDIGPCTISKVDNPKPKRAESGVFLLEGPPEWLVAPQMVSLFTFMVRIGYGHVKGKDYRNAFKKPYYSPDGSLTGQYSTGLRLLYRGAWRDLFGTNITKNYPNWLTADTMHGCGFCCWLSSGSHFAIKHHTIQAPEYHVHKS